MRNLVAVTFMFALLPVSASEPDPRVMAKLNQHIAIGVALANYRCEHGEWPESIEILRTHFESKNLPLPVEIDWSIWSRRENTWEVAELVRLHTARDDDEPLVVTTTHSPGNCEPNSLQPNMHVELGR